MVQPSVKQKKTLLSTSNAKTKAKKQGKDEVVDNDYKEEGNKEEEDDGSASPPPPTKGRKTKKAKKEEVVEDGADDDDELGGFASLSFAELRALAKVHNVRGKSKVELIRGLKEKNVDATQNDKDVPFTSEDLLAATAAELRAWGEQVGARSRKKEDLLRELRNMLPIDDQWASSDDDWESIKIPGCTGYGNVDIREGIPEGCVHFSEPRLGPTCRAGHIPFAAALVGFREWRRQYSPIIEGVVVREKDAVKLRGLMALKDAKAERKETNEIGRQNTPKVQPAWTFLDLPPEIASSNQKDFSLLPRDAWMCIFRFCDALDVVVCGRVCTSLRRLSLDEQLWRSKLFTDFSCSSPDVEDQLAKGARALYLQLGSKVLPNWTPNRPGLGFAEVYKARAIKWIQESVLDTRREALD